MTSRFPSIRPLPPDPSPAPKPAPAPVHDASKTDFTSTKQSAERYQGHVKPAQGHG